MIGEPSRTIQPQMRSFYSFLFNFFFPFKLDRMWMGETRYIPIYPVELLPSSIPGVYEA